MKKLLAVVLAVIMLVHPAASAVNVSAQAAISYEVSSGAVVYAKNEHAQLGMASTTKIMTAILAIENGDLTERVTVKAEHSGVEGSSMYLGEGDTPTLEELLYGLLLSSGNDAAEVIADHIGGSVEKFVEMMNTAAKALNMENTHYTNPHGLSDPEHYSSAYDMAILTAHALKNETFAKIVSTHVYTGELGSYYNHNKMLDMYSGADGVKTGYTAATGRCLVTSAERDGVRIVAVTLDDRNDWADHAAMLDAGFERFKCVELTQIGQEGCKIPVFSGSCGEVSLVYGSVQTAVVEQNTKTAEVRFYIPRFEYAPICAGDTAGRAEFVADGRVIAECELIYAEDVEQVEAKRPGLFERIAEWVGNLFG